MKIYKTAQYRITPESQTSVEQAMHGHAERLKRDFPEMLWWTARNQEDPFSYITIIVAPDEQTNRSASDSDGTAEFVDALYPNVVGEVKWTDWQHIASTGSLHQ